jgi:peptidoglycan/LPS O-acetylase OafA/YrhL
VAAWDRSEAGKDTADSQGAGSLRRRLTRKVSSGRYIAEVDGLRFVAIAAVLVFHVGVIAGLQHKMFLLPSPFGAAVPVADANGMSPNRSTDAGVLGVYLFFIVSGFVLAAPFIRARVFAGQSVSVSRYFLRRLTRIEPPFIVAIFLLLLTAWSMGQRVPPGQVLAGLGYMHTFRYGIPNVLNGVAWSLETEVQWYVTVPFLALVLTGGADLERRLRVLILFAAAVAFHNEWTVDLRDRILLLENLPYFLAGWLLADIYVTRWKDAPRTGPAWDVLGIFAWLTLFVVIPLDEFSHGYTVPLVGFVACASAFRGRYTQRVLRASWLAIPGGMCYSIYLTHWPVFVLLRDVREPWGSGSSLEEFAVWFVVLIPCALAVSIAFYVLIERPTMDPTWPARAWSRLRTLVDLGSRARVSGRAPAHGGSLVDDVLLISDEVVVRVPDLDGQVRSTTRPR